MKSQIIKVFDIPNTAAAAEVEQVLNSLYPDDYYLERIVQNGLPEGIGMRAIFKLSARTKK